MLKYKIAAALLAALKALYAAAFQLEDAIWRLKNAVRTATLEHGRAMLQAELNAHLRAVEVQRQSLADANKAANVALKEHTGKVDALYAKVYDR